MKLCDLKCEFNIILRLLFSYFLQFLTRRVTRTQHPVERKIKSFHRMCLHDYSRIKDGGKRLVSNLFVHLGQSGYACMPENSDRFFNTEIRLTMIVELNSFLMTTPTTHSTNWHPFSGWNAERKPKRLVRAGSSRMARELALSGRSDHSSCRLWRPSSIWLWRLASVGCNAQERNRGKLSKKKIQNTAL